MITVIQRTCSATAALTVATAIGFTAHALDPLYDSPVILTASNVGVGSSFSGDFDNDGKTEFVTSLSSNHLTIFRWDTGSSTIQRNLIEGNGAGHLNRYGGDLVTADVNGDGFLDIVVPNSNNQLGPGNIFWYQNPGTAGANSPFSSSWARHTVTSWSGSGTQNADNYVRHMSEIEAGDIDGDGDVDILTRDVQFGLFLMRNDGGGTWTRRHIAANPREGMALYDFDGDGDQDIAINGIWLETPGTPGAADLTSATFTQHAYDQNGPIGSENQYPATNDAFTQNQYAKKVKVADINKDGRADIVVSNAEQLGGANNGGPKGIRVYLAPTDPTNTAGWTEVILSEGSNVIVPAGDSGVSLTSRYGLHNLELGDINRDGNLDILSATSTVSDGSAPARIFRLLNNGDMTFTFQSIDDVKAYNSTIADFDGDGDLDLFGAYGFGTNGPVWYYENIVPVPEPAGVTVVLATTLLMRRAPRHGS